MLYLPRFSYYLLLLIAAMFVTTSNGFAIAIVSGIFFYLPISITVWAFSTIYEKLFKAADSLNGRQNASASLKLMYVTAGIAVLLLTIGVMQGSTRTAGYGVAAVFFSVEQLIGMRERRRTYTKRNSH